MDIIIGLPYIHSHFLTILTEMLIPSSLQKVDFDSATISNLQVIENKLDYLPVRIDSYKKSMNSYSS